jgi:serine protease Do
MNKTLFRHPPSGTIRRAGTLALLAFAGLLSAAEPSPGPMELARQLNEAFVRVAERVSPSVVVIAVTRRAEAAASELEASPFWEWFPREFRRQFEERFRAQPENPHRRAPLDRGQGSGVVIREDGYILTNGHVVENAEKIKVRFKDGSTYDAEVRGVDPQSDIAVLKIEARGLPAARFGDSDRVRVGEFAIAIGAPFELDYSVTFGHVSAKARSDLLPDPTMDQDFIQTDANINPGNSGGPLVNIEGEIIGINTLIRGLRTGIGFAIPSNLARQVADKLIEEGRFTRSWLGVEIRALREDEEFRALAKNVRDGVVVRGIVRNGPAAKSALKLGDVITAVDGTPVATAQELRNQIRTKRAGSSVTLDVVRAGRPLQIKVQPEPWPEETLTASSRRASAPRPAEATGLGLTVKPMTPELAKEMNLDYQPGAVVTAVEADSLAEARGIQHGDLITEIDQKPVASLRDFNNALNDADLRRGVTVHLLREGVSRLVILKESED